MIDKWLVFGGWGVEPSLLEPLFGAGTVWLDANTLIPSCMQDEQPLPDWPSALAKAIEPLIPDGPFGIAGWSTGAMLAWAVADIFFVECGVFLSATPSFCRRPDFPFGQKSAVLQAMRKQLASGNSGVLRDFYTRCGLDGVPIPPYASGQLITGLHFLEQATLLPVEPVSCSTLFLHGTADDIIPPAAGKYFSRQAGGSCIEYDGPHAFFAKRTSGVADVIRQFSLHSAL